MIDVVWQHLLVWEYNGNDNFRERQWKKQLYLYVSSILSEEIHHFIFFVESLNIDQLFSSMNEYFNDSSSIGDIHHAIENELILSQTAWQIDFSPNWLIDWSLWRIAFVEILTHDYSLFEKIFSIFYFNISVTILRQSLFPIENHT